MTLYDRSRYREKISKEPPTLFKALEDHYKENKTNDKGFAATPMLSGVITVVSKPIELVIRTRVQVSIALFRIHSSRC